MKMVKITPAQYMFIGPITVYKYKTDDRVNVTLPDGSIHAGTIHGLAMDAGPNAKFFIVNLDEPIECDDTGLVYKSMMISESQLALAEHSTMTDGCDCCCLDCCIHNK